MHFVNKPVPISVFVLDMTLHDNWEAQIAAPAAG